MWCVFGSGFFPNGFSRFPVKTQHLKRCFRRWRAASTSTTATTALASSTLPPAGRWSRATAGGNSCNHKNFVLPNHRRTGTLARNRNFPFHILGIAPLDWRRCRLRNTVTGGAAPVPPVVCFGGGCTKRQQNQRQQNSSVHGLILFVCEFSADGLVKKNQSGDISTDKVMQLFHRDIPLKSSNLVLIDIFANLAAKLLYVFIRSRLFVDLALLRIRY